jgi:EF hand
MKRVMTILLGGAALTAIALAAMAETTGKEVIATVIFDQMDTDHDGQISTAEVTALKSAQFAKADTDANGILDKAELGAVRDRMAQMIAKAGARAASSVTRMDLNGDGDLTLAEYTATSPMFALLDANGDGAVARAEFDRARAAFAN